MYGEMGNWKSAEEKPSADGPCFLMYSSGSATWCCLGKTYADGSWSADEQPPAGYRLECWAERTPLEL